jgi:hypothetical protein
MATSESRSGWPASTRTIFFLVVVLTVAGVYFAFQVPISVFPDTNFPRVVIGVDNGVMPVEQMQVTITKPIEDAVNSVPGLAHRPLDHQPRIGRGEPVLRLERGHVPLAATGRCGALSKVSRRCRRRPSSPPTGSRSPRFPFSATA